MGDEHLVRELRLWTCRGPRFFGVVENGDRVLVAILITSLDAHDERHRHPVGGRGRDVVRGFRRVVRFELGLFGIGRAVQVFVGGWLVALAVGRSRLTCPGVNLRSGEHRSARRIVGEHDLRSRPVGELRRHRVGSFVEARHEAEQRGSGLDGEGRGLVFAAHVDRDFGWVLAGRNGDFHQCFAADHQVRAARELGDRDRGRRFRFLSRRAPKPTVRRRALTPAAA